MDATLDEDAGFLERMRRRRPPCIETLNGEVVAIDSAAGRATMRFVATEAFCHSGDIVQGGFVTGMLDAAMSQAAIARSRLTANVPTLEIKVSFFAPAHPGVLRAEGRVARWGRSVAFLEGTLHDPQDRVVASATATIRLVPRERKATG